MPVTEKEAYDGLVYLVLSDLCMVEKFPSVQNLGDLQTNIQHLATENAFESGEDLEEFVKCCMICGYSLDTIVSFLTGASTPDEDDAEKLKQGELFLKNMKFVNDLGDGHIKLIQSLESEHNLGIQYLTTQNGFESSEDLEDFVKCCMICNYGPNDVRSFLTGASTPDEDDAEKLKQGELFLKQYSTYLSKKSTWDALSQQQ